VWIGVFMFASFNFCRMLLSICMTQHVTMMLDSSGATRVVVIVSIHTPRFEYATIPVTLLLTLTIIKTVL
jgi:hypothetical protein